MANTEIFGGVGVTITGNFSPMMESIFAAERAANEAGSRISQAFNSAAPGVSRLDQSVSSLVSSVGEIPRATKEAGAAIQQAGQNAQAAGFNFRYALFAVKDFAEGRWRFGMAEVVNELVRFGPAALAAGTAIAAVGYGIYELLSISKDLEKIGDAFRAITGEAEKENDALIVANDKLEKEIDKIQKKPNNGIKLAIDEAILSAIELGLSLDKDLAKLVEFTTKQEVGIGARIFGQAGTADITEEILKFQRRVAEASKASIPRQESVGGVDLFTPAALEAQKTAAQTRTVAEQTRLYTEEIQRFSRELQAAMGPPSGFTVDAQRRIAVLTDTIANLRQQAASIGIKTDNANLTGKRAQLGDKPAKDTEARDLKRADEEDLAELKSHHQLSVGEIIRYWTQRREAESTNADRVREITIQLGNLYQEQDKVFQRIAERGAKLQDEAVKKAEKQQAFLTAMALEATRLGDKSGDLIVTAGAKETEVAAKGSADQAQAAAAAEKLRIEREYGLQVTHTEAQQLANMVALAAQDAKVRTAKQTQLAVDAQQAAMLAASIPTEENILRSKEAQVALEKEIAANANAAYGAETRRLEAARRLTLQYQLRHAMKDAGEAVPGALGNAAAKGLLDGKKAGQDIAQALKGVGQQMLGNVFTALIHQLVSTLAANTAVQAAMHLILGTAAVAQGTNTAAQTANATASVTLAASNASLTVAVADLAAAMWVQDAMLGFADGGSPPVGVPSLGGERGPEVFIGESGETSVIGARGPQLFTPSERGMVIPNHKLGDLGGAAPIPAGSPSSTSGDASGPNAGTADGGRRYRASGDAAPRSRTAAFGAPGNHSLFIPREPGAVAPDRKIKGFADGGGMQAVALAAPAQTEAFGQFAAGTDYAPGGWAMVGEKGPEPMYVPRGAQIIPEHKPGGFADGTSTPAFMSSTSHRGGDMHMHTTIHVHESSNPAHTARAVAGYLKSTFAGFSPASSR